MSGVALVTGDCDTLGDTIKTGFLPTTGMVAISAPPSTGNPQFFNRYSYTNNNPINYTDPTGHWVETELPQKECYCKAEKVPHAEYV